MKKRMIAGVMVAIMLASAVTGCAGKKSNVKKVEIDSVEDITYEAVYNANKGSTLLEYYDNVQYVYEIGTGDETEIQTWTLLGKKEDYVICQDSSVGETMVYKDGTCYYKNETAEAEEGEEKEILYAKGWFMDGVYEDYMQICVDSFLIEQGSEEEFTMIEEKEDTYVIWSEVGAVDNQTNYYRYTVEQDTLLIQLFEAVIVTESEDGTSEEEVVAKSVISSNVEYKEPVYVKELEAAKETRTITVLVDGEQEEKVELPSNATLLPALADGYGMYEDADQIAEFDDSLSEPDEDGNYGDVTVYCLKNE